MVVPPPRFSFCGCLFSINPFKQYSPSQLLFTVIPHKFVLHLTFADDYLLWIKKPILLIPELLFVMASHIISFP